MVTSDVARTWNFRYNEEGNWPCPFKGDIPAFAGMLALDQLAQYKQKIETLISCRNSSIKSGYISHYSEQKTDNIYDQIYVEGLDLIFL